MKVPENIAFLINSKELQIFLGFRFFIFCNWGALGAILPSWFEQAQSLQNFNYYYSTLTFIAGTGFLWTNLIYKIETRKLLIVLSFLYLIRGVLFLFPTNILSSFLSGICGGIGFIFCTLISRIWIESWNNEKEKSYVIGWSSSGFRISTALSIALTSLCISVLGTKFFETSIIILLFSIMPSISYFFWKSSKLKVLSKPTVPIISKIYQCFQYDKSLMIWNLLINLFSGLHVGLIISYVPIILNKIGFEPAIGLSLISIGSFLKIFCEPILSTVYQPKIKGVQIFIIGILNALLLLMWGIPFLFDYLIYIVLITFMMQAAFTFFEINIFYAVFPEKWSLQLFTLGNCIFHLGNIGGNFLGNLMISHCKIQYLIFTGAFMIGFSGLLYYLFINFFNTSSSAIKSA